MWIKDQIKKIIGIGVALIVLVGGVLWVRAYQTEQVGRYADLDFEPLKRGQLTSIVSTTGTVRANQDAVILWGTSGVVEQVGVEVGDTVVKGDFLAALDEDTLPANVILARAELVEAQSALAVLQDATIQEATARKAVEDAERALEDAQNPSLEQAEAQKAVADAQSAYEDAERALAILTKPAPQSAIEAAHAQLLMAENVLNRTKDNLAKAQRKAKKKESEYQFWESKDLYKDLAKNLEMKLTQDQLSYERALNKYNDLNEPPDPNDVAVAEANLETAAAQLDAAQREWERVKDGASPATLAVLDAQLADARREHDRVKDGPDPDDILAAEARVAAAQAALEQIQITAPFSGVITDAAGKVGDQVAQGSQAFRIDDLSHLLIDVLVSEIDINQVRIGQPVVLKFDAVSGSEYHGEVVKVPQVGEIIEGLTSFRVVVEILDADDRVKPGMTAEAEIIVAELEDALLVPRQAIRMLEGQPVVYVLDAGNLVPHEITPGISNADYTSLVETDLKIGDQIVANPPANVLQTVSPSGNGS